MKAYRFFSYISILLWILFIFGGYFLFSSYDTTIEELIFGAKYYILDHPWQGVIFFVLVYIIRPLFFVIATPFDIFSGLVFGPFIGFIVSAIATTFSSMFSYWVGYMTGGYFVEKKSSQRIKKLKEKLYKDTFYNAMMMRFLLLPYDLSNYVAGALKAPYVKYISGTSIGVLPATFVFVSAGSAFHGEHVQSYQTLLENIKYENLWFASGFFITILILARLLKRRYKNITI